MKRDMDLVRKILLACEASEHSIGPDLSKIENYDEEQIGFHVYLMIQAGLLEGSETTTMSSMSHEAFVSSITWAGYEFLEACRDEERWNKVKTAAKSVGGWTLEVLKATLIEMAVSGMKKAVGLQ